MDSLHLLEPKDLAQLLQLDQELVLGRIIEMNGRPEYHNKLDAIELVHELAELRTKRVGRKRPRASRNR